MPIRFQPKTDADMAKFELLPKGEYDAEILLCEEQASKKEKQAAEREGREPQPNMFRTKFGVYTGHGERQEWIFEYIMSDSPNLRRLSEACGLLADYNSGELRSDQFVGQALRVKVDIEPEKPKDGGGVWPAKNKIAGYVLPKRADKVVEVKPAPRLSDEPLDDSIPF